MEAVPERDLPCGDLELKEGELALRADCTEPGHLEFE